MCILYTIREDKELKKERKKKKKKEKEKEKKNPTTKKPVD